MADVIGGAFGYVAVGFETYCPGLSGTHRWVPECGRGASEAVVWTSHDGEAWTRARSVTAFEPIGECVAGGSGRGVTMLGRQFVVVGTQCGPAAWISEQI